MLVYMSQYQCVSIYIQSATHPLGIQTCPVSDVGAFGMVGGGGGGRVGPSLFGVVEAVVVLVGAGGVGLRGAAGDERSSQQAEDGAHPASVEGEPEGHEAVLMMGPDGKPNGRHNTTHGCEEQDDGSN